MRNAGINNTTTIHDSRFSIAHKTNFFVYNIVMKATFENSVLVLQQLLKIPSVKQDAAEGAPFGKANADALNFMLNFMQGCGFRVKNVDGFCGFAEIGDPDAELFAVLGHLDVVPEGAGWTFDPYGGEIDSGKLYGRGAEDNKGPTVAAIFAALNLLQQGKTLKKRLRFIFGCDEESGWACMDRYKETEELPAMGFAPDADFPVVNCEKGLVYHKVALPLPAGIIKIEGGERANIVPSEAKAILQNGSIIKTQGKSSHASKPQEGDNAIVKLLKELNDTTHLPSPISHLTSLYNAFKCYNGTGVNLNLGDNESGALTMNLGTAKTVNGNLELGVDVRHPITYDKNEITKRLTKALPFCKVEQGRFHLPLYVAESDFLVQSLLKAYNEVMGGNARPITIGGATYARAFNKCVSFGPVFPNDVATLHQKDECVTLENYQKMQLIFGKALEKLCF
jgi:succinyl-diaminopimelate desuccinylase